MRRKMRSRKRKGREEAGDEEEGKVKAEEARNQGS